jgi:hypothetical protein
VDTEKNRDAVSPTKVIKLIVQLCEKFRAQLKLLLLRLSFFILCSFLGKQSIRLSGMRIASVQKKTKSGAYREGHMWS